jgi:hypothetical protein
VVTAFGSNAEELSRPSQSSISWCCSWLGSARIAFRSACPQGAAAVLWWAGAFRGDEHWVVGVGIGIEQVFDHDLVLPVIAEVLGVAEPVADAADQLAEAHAALVVEPQFGIGGER